MEEKKNQENICFQVNKPNRKQEKMCRSVHKKEQKNDQKLKG